MIFVKAKSQHVSDEIVPNLIFEKKEIKLIHFFFHFSVRHILASVLGNGMKFNVRETCEKLH